MYGCVCLYNMSMDRMFWPQIIVIIVIKKSRYTNTWRNINKKKYRHIACATTSNIHRLICRIVWCTPISICRCVSMCKWICCVYVCECAMCFAHYRLISLRK